MPKVKEILHSAKLELQSLGFNTPQLDAELLLAAALKVEKDVLFMRHEEYISDTAFKTLLERRKKFEPIAYIIGHKEFWGLGFFVTRDTLIPRPDSETVIEYVLATYPYRDEPYSILDLGTGTGCLGLSLLHEYKNAHATLLDISTPALQVAELNTKNLGFQDRTTLIQSSWFETLSPQQFDIIVCNPPYIASGSNLIPDVALHEPHSALFAEEDGYREYQKIAADLHLYLKPTGSAFFEFGKDQETKLASILLNYKVLGIKKDMAGINRVLACSS